MLIKTRNQNKSIQSNNHNDKILKNKSFNPNPNQRKNIKKNHNQIQTQEEKQKDQNQSKPYNHIICIPQKTKPNNNLFYQTPIIKQKPSINLSINTYQATEVYQDEILTYLKNLQQKYRINQDYIKFHKKLTPKLRNFMIQFMFKVCLKFKCSRRTIFLAVYCFDYYMSKNLSVQYQQKIISIAQASLHIAMKYEQIYPPSLRQWTSSHNYSQILNSQTQIIKTLDFKLNLPSIYYFQQYFLQRSSSVNQIISYEPSKLNDLKLQLISDICLFDTALYAYTGYNLTLNIIRLVNNIPAPFKQERIVLNIKWAIQRNSTMIEWLKQNFYRQLRNT